jgi:hypothetical protein
MTNTNAYVEPTQVEHAAVRASGRLGLICHFESVFTKILQERAHCSRSEIVEALASEAASWVEAYDEFMFDEDRPTTGPVVS